jgi:hypothetical protein
MRIWTEFVWTGNVKVPRTGSRFSIKPANYVTMLYSTKFYYKWWTVKREMKGWKLTNASARTNTIVHGLTQVVEMFCNESHRLIAGTLFKVRVFFLTTKIGIKGNQTWDIERNTLKDLKLTTWKLNCVCFVLFLLELSLTLSDDVVWSMSGCVRFGL